MAFDLNAFIPTGGQSTRGKAPQKWSYKTTDSLATQDTSGYFNGAADRLAVCDVIESVVTTSGVPTSYGILLVQAVSAAGVVEVFNAVLSDTTLSDAD